MSEQSIRVFLAVPVPDSVRASIDSAAAPLRARLPRVRWVRADLWHFTLIFLGERPPAEVRHVERVATEVCRGTRAFQFGVQGTGCFPGAARPRVLWVGAGSGVDDLAGLRDGLYGALRADGIPVPNESFSAHLTVGRVRDDTSSEERSAIGALWSSLKISVLPAFDLREARLMRSDLGPGGPRYTPLATFPLEVTRED
jgi:2'-5' RNA ligase